MIRVTVWNEYYHEVDDDHVRELYPKGIHGCIADFLGTEDDIVVKTVTMKDENFGIT